MGQPQMKIEKHSVSDILSNIRRIISEDNISVAAEAVAGEMRAKEEAQDLPPEAPVAEKSSSASEAVTNPSEPVGDDDKASQPLADEAELPDEVLQLTESVAEPEEAQPSNFSRETEQENDDRLVDTELAQAVLKKLGALSDGSAENLVEILPVRTIVREILQPELKDWLNQHLEEIVERILREEITRLLKESSKATT